MIARRAFHLSAVATAAAGLLPALHAQAQQKPPQEGKDYVRLDKPAPVDTPPGRVEVIEFFWYSCPHCNAFEPQFDSWAKNAPKDVAVRRMPIAFRPDFAPQQKLYFALESMGRLDDMHRRVFTAIHAERLPLATDAAIAAWVAKQGVDAAKFQEAYNSFSVATKVRRASQLQDAYKVEGVPSLGIAGRWYTDGTMAGNLERALQVANQLIAEARKAPART